MITYWKSYIELLASLVIYIVKHNIGLKYIHLFIVGGQFDLICQCNMCGQLVTQCKKKVSDHLTGVAHKSGGVCMEECNLLFQGLVC